MLSSLFDQVRQAVTQHGDQQQGRMDTGGLLGTLEGLFSQHASNTGQQWSGGGNVLPASQDPYGDPADRAAGILPASADPLGDPGR